MTDDREVVLQVKVEQQFPFTRNIGNVFTDVINERRRQYEKWQEDADHQQIEWLSILVEEVGEYAELVNKDHWRKEGESDKRPRMRAEMIQVAAVIVAAIQCLDRDLQSNP